jgi:ribosomal protein S18 acetylase RimI-like enzyme
VRAARLQDLPATCRIFEASLSNVPAMERGYFLARERGVYVLDVVGLGVCGFHVATIKDASTTLWVEYLGVDPAHQRAGFGRMLMGHCEQLGKELTLARVGLRPRDPEARAFYERLGYVAERSHEGDHPRLYKPLPKAETSACEPRAVLGRYRLRNPFEAVGVAVRYAILTLAASRR